MSLTSPSLVPVGWAASGVCGVGVRAENITVWSGGGHWFLFRGAGGVKA